MATEQMQTIIDALEECEEYFDQRADADYEDERYVGNKEMNLLTVVREAIAKAKEPKGWR